MKHYAVCYVTQDSPTAKWTVVLAADAREAAKIVREKTPMCNICGVYKRMDEWRWA